jgi:hypothetical protein
VQHIREIISLASRITKLNGLVLTKIAQPGDAHVPEQNNDAPKTLSRRAAITAVAVVPLSGQLSVGLAAVGDEVAQLVKRADEKNAAFMRGDMDRWLGLAHIAPDFTLM